VKVDKTCEKRIGFLAILDVVFIVFLILSGSFGGVLSTLFYILAFIVPICVGFYMTREENSNVDFIRPHGVGEALPFIAPTIGGVMLISFLTSLLIGLMTGKNNAIDLGDSLILAILSHALAPAILEEALFRFIPMRAMKGERWPVIMLYSALFFALIHHSFFSMPYAFLAGLVFMLVDLIADSVWPSVVIHFLNNTLSVVLVFYSDIPAVAYVAISVLAVLTAVSVIYIIRNKGKYEKIKEKMADIRSINFSFPREAFMLVIPMLILALMELIQ
jgi:membrane protease YdiL (CAAX protease family)